MPEKYEIVMGNIREDYTITYTEYLEDHSKKNLFVAVDLKVNFFIFPAAYIHLKSFSRWDNQEELTLDSYIKVLKRIFDFLRAKGYRVRLLDSLGWMNPQEVNEFLKSEEKSGVKTKKFR